MFYKEFLQMRKALVGPAIAIVVTAIAGTVLGITVPDMHTSFTLTDVLIGGGFAGAIAATIAAATIPYENEGHLESAFTKPISRTRYALGMALANSVGILGAFLVGAFCTAIVLSTMGGKLSHSSSGPLVLQALRYVAFPFAWFGLIGALTARLRLSGFGTVISVAWPIAIMLSLVTLVPLAPAWHTLVSSLNVINPVHYAPLWWNVYLPSGAVRIEAVASVGLDIAALMCMAVVGIGLTAWQWTFVEA